MNTITKKEIINEIVLLKSRVKTLSLLVKPRKIKLGKKIFDKLK